MQGSSFFRKSVSVMGLALLSSACAMQYQPKDEDKLAQVPEEGTSMVLKQPVDIDVANEFDGKTYYQERIRFYTTKGPVETEDFPTISYCYLSVNPELETPRSIPAGTVYHVVRTHEFTIKTEGRRATFVVELVLENKDFPEVDGLICRTGKDQNHAFSISDFKRVIGEYLELKTQ